MSLFDKGRILSPRRPQRSRSRSRPRRHGEPCAPNDLLDPVPRYGVHAVPVAPSAEEILTIGQLARRAGVGVETIRFYEREGLVAAPARRASGYRQYPADVVRRVRFIRHAKDLGFTLREIHELLALRVDPDSTCADVRARARAKIADVEGRIASLERMKAALERLARACRGRGPTSDCPILEELDREEDAGAGR